jgi:hypothetical protein
MFFYYFSDPTARLEATATFSNFLLDDFDHCDSLSTSMKQAGRLSGGPQLPVTKRPHFASEQKGTSCHNPGKKRFMYY